MDVWCLAEVGTAGACDPAPGVGPAGLSTRCLPPQGCTQPSCVLPVFRSLSLPV